MPIINIFGSSDEDEISTYVLGFPIVTSFEIRAESNNDLIKTGAGADVIYGGKGNDRLYAGWGDDLIFAGNHDDYVHGGKGDDRIFGGAGNDRLYGNKGSDEIDGGSGDDMIYGTKGYNILSGGTGNDVIDSGRHSSTLSGGDGDDRLIGNLSKGGDHLMNGGAGADLFIFTFQQTKKLSEVTIEDFELGTDEFEVLGLAGVDFLATGAVAMQDGADVVLEIGFGDTVRFADTELDAFEAEYGIA